MPLKVLEMTGSPLCTQVTSGVWLTSFRSAPHQTKGTSRSRQSSQCQDRILCPFTPVAPHSPPHTSWWKEGTGSRRDASSRPGVPKPGCLVWLGCWSSSAAAAGHGRGACSRGARAAGPELCSGLGAALVGFFTGVVRGRVCRYTHTRARTHMHAHHTHTHTRTHTHTPAAGLPRPTATGAR